MSIERISQSQHLSLTGPLRDNAPRTEKREQRNLQETACQESGTQVKLSVQTQTLTTDEGHDIDHTRVAAIKAQMDAGELHLDSDKIANALIDDIIHFS